VTIFDNLSHTVKVVVVAPGVGTAEAAYAAAQERIEREVALLRGPSPADPHAQPGAPVKFESSMGQAAYEAAVERAREFIRAGDVIQVVLSHRLSAPVHAHPFDVYRALRVLNPSPYMYYLRFPDLEVVGSSPEVLVRVEGARVETHPIAGTRPRGRNADDDRRLAEELEANEKERAEHVMLVDLGRNDVGRVSAYGTVQVPQFMSVERFSHVMHLTSIVEGELAKDCDRIDALVSCFPAGTVSGAPKVRAMQIIRELEPSGRGLYAGAVGYLDFAGNLDFCIAIRTVIMSKGNAYVQAGAGIVMDSNPAAEYQETRDKAQALVRALELAQEGL
jgi:anthranilate synthase component 1